MAKRTPLQEVKERYGSKEALAQKLIPKLERRDEETDADFQTRIKTASNAQLLRLIHVTETLEKRFGTKEKLVEAIVSRKFPKGNAGYRDKLLGYQASRLLNLFEQLS